MTRAALGRLWREHRRAVIGFVLAALVTLFFAVSLVVSALDWRAPGPHHAAVKSWMTIGYVARSWGLKPHDIDVAAGLPGPQGGHPLTLRAIARQRGVPVSQIIQLVEETVTRLKAAQDLP